MTRRQARGWGRKVWTPPPPKRRRPLPLPAVSRAEAEDPRDRAQASDDPGVWEMSAELARKGRMKSRAGKAHNRWTEISGKIARVWRDQR